ncbi:acyltransferase [Oleiagrimonas sp. C23AA]|uniref:acyltransferase family protein n=1 Tax=Oleiagrimonas sp. C23AA TaxID=2719047 RepID=UPI001421F5B7|nr:acyltransferase [Oleiagrimonas sp. C23AA]NII10635.1 acyltransferase [Oleiagrimonas sp. C23AA]
MASTPHRALARNSGIDLLRGVSIVLVLCNHIGLRIPLQHTALAAWLPVRLLKAVIYNGLPAVYMFFVISGFLITTNLLRRWGEPGAVRLRAFYARRFARIVPLLLLVLVVLSGLHLAGVPDFVIHRPGQSLGGALASALGLYLNWYEAHTGYLPGNWDVLWSLSIEELFYLGFPLVCLGLARRWRLGVVLVLLALTLPWGRALAAHGNEIWLEKAYWPGMAAIACGASGALLAAQLDGSVRRGRVLAWLGGVILALLLIWGDRLWPWLGQGVMLALVVATTMLVIGLHERALGVATPSRPLPGLGWLRACGRLSYEIYLTHMFVVYTAVGLYHRWGSALAEGYLWYVPMVALALGLGSLVARTVSQPCERVLRARWLESNQAA